MVKQIFIAKGAGDSAMCKYATLGGLSPENV